jgi:hypothetical protein
VEPGASYVRWDDNLGLEDAWLYGGALTFELGSRVRLSPFYMTRSNLEADPTGLEAADSLFPGAEPFELDTRHIGAMLDLDLTDGNVVPFLRVGGGILRFDPDEGDALDRIALTYGGGLRFGVGRAGIRLFAEGTSFRLDPARLYAPDATFDGEEDTQTNLVGGARVSIPISAMPDDLGVGLASASVPVGIFAGEMRFASELGLDDQRLAGVRAGVAFNPLVSLQGFYWRGVNDDFDATEDMTGYGAEALFDIGSGAGLSPYLIVGGGRIDFEDEPEDGEALEDRTALILGAGLSFRLSDRVHLDASARDYLMDPGREIEETADPGDLTSSWLYSAALSVNIGGTTAQSRRRSAREARLQGEMDRLQRQMDSVQSAMMDEQRTAAERERMDRDQRERMDRDQREREDREERERMERDRADRQRTGETRSVRTPDGRVITLPVLEEGSVYIRFGSEGADTGPRGAMGDLTGPELRERIRGIVESVEGEEQEMSDEDMDALELLLLQRLRERRGGPAAQGDTMPSAVSMRILERLDEIEARLDRQMQGRTMPPAARPVPAEEEAEGTGAFSRAGRMEPMATLPYAGLQVGDDTQGTIGARLDFGPLEEGSPFRFVPEATFGFGDGDPSLTVMGNLLFTVASFGGERRWEPYLLGGAGFYSPTFLGLSTGVGVEFDLPTDQATPLRGFAELQGINLFDTTRFLFGVTLRR